MYEIVSLNKLVPFVATYEYQGQQTSQAVFVDPTKRRVYPAIGGAVVGCILEELQLAILEAYDRLNPRG